MQKIHRSFHVCLRALAVFGDSIQIDKAIEECTELALELQRFRQGRTDIERVRDEIADVQIMVEQMTLLFGVGAVDMCKSEKLERLERLIEEKEREESRALKC